MEPILSKRQPHNSDGLLSASSQYPNYSTFNHDIQDYTLHESEDTLLDVNQNENNGLDECSSLMDDEKGMSGGANYMQSTMNTVNLMVGMSLLSLPYTMKTGGWICGIGLISLLGLITLYTALVLTKCMSMFSDVFNLGDLGFKVYGNRGRYVISSLYVVELLSCGVGFCIVVGDSLYALMNKTEWFFSAWTTFEWKLLAITVMIGTSLVESTRIQFIASASGVLASILLLAITLYDGLSTPNAPGSVWDPAETKILPVKWSDTFLNLGKSLVIFTYSGHSVIPVIYKKMKKPSQFKSMVSFSWTVIMLWLLGVPICCYLMFGDNLRDEFTINLWETPSYNKPLNGMLLWLIIVVSTSKYSLVMSPIAHIFLPPQEVIKETASITPKRFMVCTGLGGLAFFIAHAFPKFSQFIGLIGAMLSFAITMIFPCACHLTLNGTKMNWAERQLQYVFILLGVLGGVFGSYGCYMHMITADNSIY